MHLSLEFSIDTNLILIITVIIFGLVALFLKSVSVTDRPVLVLIFFSVYLVYYIFFEFNMGQTPGKRITYTCVVGKDNTKIKLQDAFLGTLLRISGFDMHSYLFGTELGMHGALTNTRVIKDTKKKAQLTTRNHGQLAVKYYSSCSGFLPIRSGGCNPELNENRIYNVLASPCPLQAQT